MRVVYLGAGAAMNGLEWGSHWHLSRQAVGLAFNAALLWPVFIVTAYRGGTWSGHIL